MTDCTDKLREARANLTNATQALRDALGADGCSPLLADCLLEQIAAAADLTRRVTRLHEVSTTPTTP